MKRLPTDEDERNQQENYGYTGKKLQYFGGPVMANPITVHFIYFGDAYEYNYTPLRDNFKILMENFGNSNYYKITVTQLPGYNGSPTTQFTWGDEWRLGSNTPFGNYIDAYYDTRVIKYYANVTGTTLNGDDLYYLFVGENIAMLNFPEEVCGYHSADYLPDGTGYFKYSLIVSTDVSNDYRCAPLDGPLGRIVDGPIATAVHETIESISDPLVGTGWLVSEDPVSEAADQCPDYINKQPLPGTSGLSQKYWNLKLGGAYFMVSGNYDNNLLKCVQPLN